MAKKAIIGIGMGSSTADPPGRAGPADRLADDEARIKRQRVRRAVSQLKRGDVDALHFLYVSFAADVQRTVLSVVRDHHEAEDITHNVFAKLPRAIHRYEERAVPFGAWVARVARNAALDHVRAHRQIPVEEVRIADGDFDQMSRDRNSDFQAALARLPEDQKRVIVMRHVVGLTPGEIADRLGKSEPAVHGLHHRGRSAMRLFLTELGSAPVV